MMKYMVLFHYMDGETFEIEVCPKDMESFVSSLNNGEVYFNNKRGVGLWIPVEKIRYFSVERVDAQGRRVVESDSRISNGDGAIDDGEAAPIEERGGGLDEALPILEGDTRLIGTHDKVGG